MTAFVVQLTLVDLIGVPYRERGRDMTGLDCWGVCLLAARDLYGISLPEYFYTEQDILPHACEHIRRETGLPHWQPVRAPYPQGAIHIFRIKGFETHCGIHLGGSDFLHSLAGRNSCVESLDSVLWSHCRTGTYQWTP